ncbi:MAG: trehalose-phosphatase [Nitrospinae bacterium RIFCSPLOWO2_12_FULL_45_22]|nr:MAG: trehalose-phosphatase [Nitrospinae bacterium RIFCSPLOWO2_12_FULL_45_22]
MSLDKNSALTHESNINDNLRATNLFQAIDQIRERLKRAAKVLLLLDYDGTLVPIAEKPELALLPENTRSLLRQLSDYPRVILGVVSGRSLAEIKELVNLEGIIYVGNHGLEMDLLAGHYVYPEAKGFLSQMRELKEILSQYLPDFPGSLLEDKGLLLSLHYRKLAPNNVPALKTLLERTLAGYSQRLEIANGKKVWEIRPRIACNKGSAVLTILESLSISEPDPLPIYLGDDRTDEDAFRALADKGITIRVGDSPSPTLAHSYLTEQKEVLEFLRLLYQEFKAQAQSN